MYTDIYRLPAVELQLKSFLICSPYRPSCQQLYHYHLQPSLVYCRTKALPIVSHLSVWGYCIPSWSSKCIQGRKNSKTLAFLALPSTLRRLLASNTWRSLREFSCLSLLFSVRFSGFWFTFGSLPALSPAGVSA